MGLGWNWWVLRVGLWGFSGVVLEFCGDFAYGGAFGALVWGFAGRWLVYLWFARALEG